VHVPNNQRRLGSHHPLQSTSSPREPGYIQIRDFLQKNADLGAAAALDLTPLLVDGTMNVILSPSEAPQRNRRVPALVAGVPLCQ